MKKNDFSIDEKEFNGALETIQKQWREFDIQRTYWIQEKILYQVFYSIISIKKKIQPTKKYKKKKRIEKLLFENKKHKEIESILIKRIKMLQYSLLQCSSRENNHQDIKDLSDLSTEKIKISNNEAPTTNSSKKQFLKG